MQLHELIFVTNYLENVAKPKNLQNLYQQLINSFLQARQSPNQAITDQIDLQKKTIKEVHKELEPKKWNVIKLKLFENFGAKKLIGKEAIKRIDQILQNNLANPQGASTELAQLMTDTNQLFSRIDQLKSGLGPLTQEKDDFEIGENQRILQLVFEGDASIGTMKDLEDNSKDWRRVFLAFSRLTEKSPSEPEIVSIEKGSIIIEVLAKVIVASAIAKGVVAILEVLEKVLEIRKKAIEVKHLKLKNKQIEKELNKEADDFRDTTIETAVRTLLKEFSKEKKDQEVENGLKSSLKTIFTFVENGGKIELYEDEEVSEEGDSTSIAKELNSAFERIRELENKVEELKLLPYNQEDEDKDGENK